MLSRKLVALGIIIILIALTLLYVTNSDGLYQKELINTFFLIPPFIAVIAGVMAIRSYGIHNQHGKSLLYITLGLASWAVGETLYAVYDLILHINPYPSIADGFYLIAYPLVIFGVLRELVSYRIDITPLRSVVVSIISLILGLLIFQLNILPSYTNEASFIENAIAVSYGISDLILIVGITHILMLTVDFRGGKLFYSWVWFLLAAIFMLLGDIFFAIYTEQYEQGIPAFKQIDIFWVISYLAFAYSLFQTHFHIEDLQIKVKKLIKNKV